MTQNKSSHEKTLFLVKFALLLAILVVIAFVPALGSIPIGPVVATTAAVPVVIAGILLGPKPGALMGFFFGLLSFIVMSFVYPTPASFIFTPFYSVGDIKGNFWSLVICFVPRILIGVVAGGVCRFFEKRLEGKKVRKLFSYGLAGVLGSLTNTFLVLGGVALFLAEQYKALIGGQALLLAIGTTVLVNGLPEAALAGIVAMGVGSVMKR
ncbi:MAG TPA: ECF transporter S component [Clostridiales bacterium]|nr:ECF transporter S component [Clostridiales bacterium]